MPKNVVKTERDNLYTDLDAIIARQAKLKKHFESTNLRRDVEYQIEKWMKEKLEEIEKTTASLQKQLEDSLKKRAGDFQTSLDTLSMRITKLQDEKSPLTQQKLQDLETLVQDCETRSKIILLLDLPASSKPDVPRVIIAKPKTVDSSSPGNGRADSRATKIVRNDKEITRFRTSDDRHEIENEKATVVSKPLQRPTSETPTLSQSVGVRRGTHNEIGELFEKLQQLPPMNKTAMQGKFYKQPTQMEDFLRREFGFENVPGETIVDGVKSFTIKKISKKQKSPKTIYFPGGESPSFAMSTDEILKWQETYTVYSPKVVPKISPSFLKRALAGGSGNGEEAFLMKFVVRISTCPVLMEFDAQVIPRRVGDDWPDRIKLVSVTGVDFACRKHDVGDITKYITNWEKIFQLDSATKLPKAPNGRDFVRKDGAPATELDTDALFNDLVTMARTRLRACEEQKVRYVVETGIGLGVFDGRYLGIDNQVRGLSASAVYQVLKEDGPHYKHIKAIIFALPIFGSTDDPAVFQRSTFHAFTKQFSETTYDGPIPVLVIDQDMHRLAVSIAKEGYQVSELNPADSHGVFGEYWQNRGPAVEEKLALTTLGLLVQHHLINPYVLDESRYHRI